jgi:hypothetical protein
MDVSFSDEGQTEEFGKCEDMLEHILESSLFDASRGHEKCRAGEG